VPYLAYQGLVEASMSSPRMLPCRAGGARVGAHAARGHSGRIVGPPLTGLDTRRMIAGRLPNTPANLALWISQPQSVDPGNAMPDTGLTRSQAAEIAAYLYAHP
jgi:cytochrome c1